VVVIGEEGDFLSGDRSACETIEEGFKAGSGFVAVGKVGFEEAGGGGGGFVVRGEGVLAFEVSGEEETEVAKVFGLESSWEKGDTVTVLVGLTGGAVD